jgi:hydrogenase maturation protein HypF
MDGQAYFPEIIPEVSRGVELQLANSLNAPLTSSIGRLFDAVAALCGLRHEVSYEGQAAIDLENCLDPDEQGSYAFDFAEGIFTAEPVMRSVLADLKRGVSVGRISARFHNGLANLVLQLSQSIRRSDGLDDAVLSGGVWQNMTLLAAARARLEGSHFKVFSHQEVPANDGGISLGQVAIAHHTLNS